MSNFVLLSTLAIQPRNLEPLRGILIWTYEERAATDCID